MGLGQIVGDGRLGRRTEGVSEAEDVGQIADTHRIRGGRIRDGLVLGRKKIVFHSQSGQGRLTRSLGGISVI